MKVAFGRDECRMKVFCIRERRCWLLYL